MPQQEILKSLGNQSVHFMADKIEGFVVVVLVFFNDLFSGMQLFSN